jgi:hypothetical protein
MSYLPELEDLDDKIANWHMMEDEEFAELGRPSIWDYIGWTEEMWDEFCEEGYDDAHLSTLGYYQSN